MILEMFKIKLRKYKPVPKLLCFICDARLLSKAEIGAERIREWEMQKSQER